eukprot:791027-Rhodomonas_salina.3
MSALLKMSGQAALQWLPTLNVRRCRTFWQSPAHHCSANPHGPRRSTRHGVSTGNSSAGAEGDRYQNLAEGSHVEVHCLRRHIWDWHSVGCCGANQGTKLPGYRTGTRWSWGDLKAPVVRKTERPATTYPHLILLTQLFDVHTLS